MSCLPNKSAASTVLINADELERPTRTFAHWMFRCVPDSLVLQLVRFGVVGGFALVLDCSILVIAVTWLHWNHLAAACVGYVAGLVLNYLLSIRWVFCERRFRDRRVEFSLFAITGLSGLGVTELILWLGTDWWLLDFRFSKLIALVCVAFWNFSIRRLWLFSNGPLLGRKVVA
jgi:putative flippase GtrA